MITFTLCVLLAVVAVALLLSVRARTIVCHASRQPWFWPVASLGALLMAVIEPHTLWAMPVAIGAILTEGQHTAEFIAAESPGKISRDTVTVTIAAATTLSAGLVLGRLTATGKYVPYDNSGADGSETAYGILYSELENEGVSPADFEGVVINWGAEVSKAALQWASGLVDADKTAAYTDLAARGVKARD